MAENSKIEWCDYTKSAIANKQLPFRATPRRRRIAQAPRCIGCRGLRELYDGWTFVEHTRQKHLHAQNGRGARPKEAPEVLILNGVSYA